MPGSKRLPSSIRAGTDSSPRPADMRPFPIRQAFGGLKRRAVLTMMIHLGISLATLSARRAQGQAGDTTTNESVTLSEFSRDRAVFDSGAARGEDAVAIPLTVNSVDAPDGNAIEVRFVDADTGVEIHPWRTLSGTLSGGTLTATYFQPTGARSTSWLRPQARVVGSSVITEATNTCGIGHVWHMWGQSNWAQLWGFYTSDIAGLFAPSATHPGDVQMLEYASVRNAINGSNPVPGPVPVDAANLHDNGGSITPAVLDFANALQAVRPGEKFMLGAFFNGGQGFGSALGDASPWQWAHNVATHDKMTENGEQVGVVWCMGWTAANWGGNVADKTTRAFLGKEVDGAQHDYTQGGVTRGFAANTTYGDDQGGLYDWSVTKFGYAGPHGRGSRDRVSPSTVTSISDIADYDLDDSGLYRSIIANLERIGQDNVNFPEVLPYVGTTSGGERGNGLTGSNNDLAHHRANTREGRQRLARIGAHNMMQTLGWMDSPLPRFDSRYDEPGGAWSDHWIDGNNTLTTLRREQGTVAGEHVDPILSLQDQGATLAPELDHRTEVMGWAINRKFAQRAEIYAVTQADVDTGHPASVGQVVCRVWPRSDQPNGFTWADEIIYGVDMLPGYLASTDNGSETAEDLSQQAGQRAFLNWAVVDMGQPSDVIEWLPVQHQLGTYTQPTTLAVPDLYAFNERLVIRGTPSGLDAATNVFMEFEGMFPDLSGGKGILFASGGKFFVEVNAQGSLSVRNGNDTIDVFNYIVQGKFFHFVVELRPAVDGTGIFEVRDRAGNVLGSIDPANLAQGNLSVTGADQVGVSGFYENTVWMNWSIWIDTADATADPTWGVVGIPSAPHYQLYGFTESDWDTAGRPIDGSLV